MLDRRVPPWCNRGHPFSFWVYLKPINPTCLVIYEFEIKPEHENAFKTIWHKLTLAIRKDFGSLGSRLHKATNKEHTWVAYAQWPTEDIWHKANQEYGTQHAKLRLVG
jgi:quinol monooxygenase YgiN